MATVQEKSADLRWIHALKQRGAIPLAQSPESSHSWASTPTYTFFVRGAHYLATKAKVPADQPLLHPLAFHLLKSSSKISSIMCHPNCRLRAAMLATTLSTSPPPSSAAATAGRALQQPFVWVFNLQLPSKDNLSLVMSYVSFHAPEHGSLMQRFLDGDDAFRNERLKMLISIPQGPRLVKLVVSARGSVCRIGKQLSCRYTREKEYIEVDVEVGCSRISQAVFELCGKLAAYITADVAFVLEGKHEHELPERIVGAVRLAKLDLSCAMSIEHPLMPNPILASSEA